MRAWLVDIPAGVLTVEYRVEVLYTEKAVQTVCTYCRKAGEFTTSMWQSRKAWQVSTSISGTVSCLIILHHLQIRVDRAKTGRVVTKKFKEKRNSKVIFEIYIIENIKTTLVTVTYIQVGYPIAFPKKTRKKRIKVWSLLWNPCTFFLGYINNIWLTLILWTVEAFVEIFKREARHSAWKLNNSIRHRMNMVI